MPLDRDAFRPMSSLLALEPRVLFDGAAAVAGADAVQHDNTADTGTADHTDTHAAATATPGTSDTTVAPAAPAATTLVVIDTSVPDYQSLLADLPANATVKLIDSGESGIQAITEALEEGGQYDSIQIVSHGSVGSFALGSDQIDSASLAEQSATLQAWAQHLSADADILLYGCDIGEGSAGLAFIDTLAQLTGADVAASSDATGAASLGGDWDLEVSTGSIETALPFSAEALAAYAGLLDAPTVTDNASTDNPVSVGENTPGVVGADIAVSGTGSDEITVTASVAKGSLNASTYTGTAAEVQAWLASLTYTYSGSSETGDSDVLSLNFTNNTSGGSTAFTRSFSVVSENDAPVLTAPASGSGRLSVAEGGSVTFAAATGSGSSGSPVTQINLGLSDVDNTQAQIIIKLTSLPGDGTLLLNGNELTVGSTFALSDISSLVYQHDGSQVTSATTDSFQITVDDGAGGLLTDQTVTVDVTPVDQAPVVSGDITLIEGETGVALVGGTVPVLGTARGDLTITDPDDASGTASVEITALPTHGTLLYDGTAVSVGQVIANADLSKFTYDNDGSENTSDSFKLIVTDLGGGTGTPKSSAETTINLTIIPNNDDPYWDSTTLPDATNTFPTVTFGPDSGTANTTTTLTLTSAMLQVDDVESSADRITYTLTEIPAGGYLTSTDYPGQYLPVGFSFTQADIDAGKISFVSTSGNNYSSEFKFTVMDGDRRLIPTERDGGIYADDTTTTLSEFTFKIDYQGTATGSGASGALDAASINAPGGTMSIDSSLIAEGQTYTLSNTQLSASSSDPSITADQLVYRLLSLPDNGQILLDGTALGIFGSFTQADVNAGRVQFVHDGSENFTSSFSFDVSNGTQTTTAQYGTSTFEIDVTPQNDTPTASNGEEVKLTEGSSIVINGSGKDHITLADSDNSTSDKSSGYATDNVLSFEVTVLPTYGTLYLDGVAQTSAGFVVTQAQLDAGLLVYTHDGSEHYSDSFTIVPLDDQGVASTSSNTDANAYPPSTDPTNQSSTGSAVVIAIGINPLNDAPTYVGKAEPGYDGTAALDEGSSFTLWGAGSYTDGSYGTGSGTASVPTDKTYYLVYEDSDNTSEQRQYRITAAPQYGTLTLNGQVLGVGSVFTQADLDAGLVQYTHNGGENSDDSFWYVVSDGDYSANQNTTDNSTAFAQGTSATASEYRILIARTNDAPTVTTTQTGLFVVDSSSTATTLPGITLADKDLADGIATGETDFVQVTVQFQDASGNAYSNGVLQFASGYDPAANGVTVTDAGGDNTLVFQGSLAAVQAALNNVQARTAGTDADASDLKIVVTVDDRLRDSSGALTAGANGGTTNQDGSTPNATYNTASLTIDVAASDLNDPAVVTMPSGPIVVNEDVRTLLSGANAITYTDPDAFDSTDNTITLTVSHGALYFSASGSTLPAGVTVTAGAVGSNTVTLQGSKAALDSALASLYYKGDSNFNGDDSLTVTVSDNGSYGQDGTDTSGAGSSTGSVAIAILPVNDTPTVSLPGAGGYESITGGSYVFSSANSNAISIADAADFITSSGSDGQQDGVDSFTVTLTATQGGSAYGTISIADSSGLASISGDGTATVVLTGTRAAINAALASGVTYTPASANLDGTVTFKVVVNDSQNGGSLLTDPTTGTAGIDGTATASKLIYLQPTDVNAAPSFSGLDNTPVYVQNSDVAVVLDANATLADPELDLFGASGDWNGATLTLQRQGGADTSDVFGVTGSGSSGVNISGTSLRIGTTVVGSIVQNSDGVLQIQFNSNATAARVDQVLQALTYRNTATDPAGSVTIAYTIDDQNSNVSTGGTAGTGQDQGTGGALTGSGSITVGINRQVVAVADSNSIVEGVAASDTDTASGDLTPGTSNNNDTGAVQDHDPDTTQSITVQGVKAGTAASVSAVGSSGVGSTVTGQYGSIVVNADGSYTYTLDNSNADVNALNQGETLTETFSYAINDGQGANQTTDFSTLTITIAGRNDPPVATNDSNSVTEDGTTSASGNVRSDTTADSDPDTPFADLVVTQIQPSGASTASSVPAGTDGIEVEGTYGTLTIHQDGSYTYALHNDDPVVQALGSGDAPTDVFTYTLSDGSLSDTATLTITINGSDDGVTVSVPDDHTKTTPDGTITDQVVFESALADGSSPSSDDLVVDSSFTLLAPDGIDASAPLSLGYTAANGSPATLTLSPAQLAALGSTSQTVTTQYGELVLDGYAQAADGTITVSYRYTLENAPTVSAATVDDVFTITGKDRDGDTGVQTLNIRIVDDQPAATADTGSILAGQTLSVAATSGVLGNDAPGADGWASGGAVVGVVAGSSGTPTSGVGSTITGSLGTLTLQADGSYTYVAAPNSDPTVVSATDVFTYTVRDADGDQTTTTLTITVVNNRAPEARDDARTTPEDTPVSGNVLGGGGAGTGDVADTDADGDTLTVTQIVVAGSTYAIPAGSSVSVVLSGQGTLVFASDGSYTFTPVADWNGSVPAIGYTVSDGTGASNGTASATLDIVVTPVADVADDSASTTLPEAVTTRVLGNDSFEGTPVVSAVTQGAHGSVVLNADGSITYTPDADFVGSDSYTYTVSSGGVTETATVTVTVAPENRVEVPADTGSTGTDTPSLLSSDPLGASPVVDDPGVYFGGERWNDVRRLPLPFNPIIYVTPEVAAAQAARQVDDVLAFSRPEQVAQGEANLSSRTAGLGMDPTLFVQQQVRASQQLSGFIGSVVDGRNGRVSLSSDSTLPTPELAQPDPSRLVDVPPAVPAGHDAGPVQRDGDAAQPAAASGAAHDAPVAAAPGDGATQQAAVPRTAPSFTQQLRSGAGRLPLAARNL